MSRSRPSALTKVDGLADIFEMPPYGADREWRRAHFTDVIARTTAHHYEACLPYRHILDALGTDLGAPTSLARMPFLPVGLFKRLDLVSVPSSEIVRTLTSSGTSRSVRARVHLDRRTALLQMLALARIGISFLGTGRMPVLVVDAHSPPGDEAGRAARSAAVEGFSLFGRGEATFALNDDLSPNLPEVQKFLDATHGRPFLVFGFTLVLWRHFFDGIDRNGVHLDLGQGTLIHGGGWKKLYADNVSDAEFRRRAQECAGINRVHNYYGMVEQPGSIYMQCESGFLHCSSFSEILVRRPEDLSLAAPGETGILQSISVLPQSYPGHNLLTEDKGVIIGEDDCDCGRLGTRFEVVGRAPTAEPRGCGDTYHSDA